MNLKMTYRDKVIFIVIIVILILVAGFFLIIKPKFEDVQSAKSALETKQQEKADIDAKIGTLPTLIQSIKDVAQQVGEMQVIFLEEGQPYENENYIRELLKSQNVNITSMETDYTEAKDIEWYLTERKNVLAYDNKMNTDLYNELPQEVYDEYNDVALPVYPASIIGVTTMTISYDPGTDMNNIYKVMNKIAEDEKTITLNSVSAEIKEPNEGGANDNEATMNLTLYSIYPLNVEKVMAETADVQPIAAEPAAETTAAE